jgi:hypothetical protein
VVEDVDVDPLDLADEPHPVGVRMGLDRKQRSVLAGQSDGGLPMAVQPADDVGIHLAKEDHLRHLDRRRVRDPHPLHESHLHAEPLHVARDVGAAAVDDHGVKPDVLEQDDVGGESLLELLVSHRRTAVLDDHRAAVELADVGERLEERANAGGGIGCGSLSHQVVYSELIRTYSAVRSEK